LDLIPVIILLALYLGLAYLTHATQGFYVYPFLDLQKNSSGLVGAYIVGILVAAVIIFLIVRYLIVLRVFVTEKRLGKTGKTLTRQHAANVDEYPLHSTVPK
jgi:predicted membrane-bound dolichyl-phosphate-mannose-protein mannosyltransferase